MCGEERGVQNASFWDAEQFLEKRELRFLKWCWDKHNKYVYSKLEWKPSLIWQRNDVDFEEIIFSTWQLSSLPNFRYREKISRMSSFYILIDR